MRINTPRKVFGFATPPPPPPPTHTHTHTPLKKVVVFKESENELPKRQNRLALSVMISLASGLQSQPTELEMLLNWVPCEKSNKTA